MAITEYNQTNRDSSSLTSDSFSFDVGSGTNRTLVVISMLYDNSSPYSSGVSTMTYNSVSLGSPVATATQTFGGSRIVQTNIYVMDDPPSGSNTLAYSTDVAPENGWFVCLGAQ